MLVVDASFLMAAFVEEVHTNFARSLLHAQAETPRIAPGLVAWEFGNILWKKMRRGAIAEGHLEAAKEFLIALDIELVDPPTPDGIAALARLGIAHGLTVYDAAYLALAAEMSTQLATADRDLAVAARSLGLTVHSPFA